MGYRPSYSFWFVFQMSVPPCLQAASAQPGNAFTKVSCYTALAFSQLPPSFCVQDFYLRI